MIRSDARSSCPPLPTLLGWFAGTVGDREASDIEQHLDACAACRQRLLDWGEHAGLDAEQSLHDRRGCADEETVVAYCAGTLPETSRLEAHLRQCEHCVQSVQRFARRQRQSGGEYAPVPVVARPAPAATPRWQHVRAWFKPGYWPQVAVAAVGVVLVVSVVRLARFSPEAPRMTGRDAGQAIEDRGVTVVVTAGTDARARPALDEPIITHMRPGERARWLEQTGEWTRIELMDGRRAWVPSQSVATSAVEPDTPRQSGG